MSIMSEAIMDNVHGLIKLTKDEMALIDHPLFQRLKSVKQLGACYQVYPGATHTRFSHSLGTMKLSGKYLNHLVKNVPEKEQIFSEKDIQLARVMGLCHDIGHGPFSHTFERAIEKVVRKGKSNKPNVFVNHDTYRYKIFDVGSFKEKLNNCIDGSTERSLSECYQNYSVLLSLIEGIIGTDRMDFTTRDAKEIGTKHYGTIPTDRLINSTTLKNGYIHYKEKSLWSIINTMTSREEMYKEVYQHKATMGLEYFIKQAIYHSYEVLSVDEILSNPEWFTVLKDSYLDSLYHVKPRTTKMVESTRKALQYYDMYCRRKKPKFLFEKYVDADKEFKKSDYKSMRQTKNGSKVIVERTKTMSGINPEQFDRNNIFFLDKDGKSVHCADILKEKKYTPIKPYYIVRLYEAPCI